MKMIIHMLQSADPEMIALGALLALKSGEQFCKENLMYRVYRGKGQGYTVKNEKCRFGSTHRHLYSRGHMHIVCTGSMIFYFDTTYYPHIMQDLYHNCRTNFDSKKESDEREIGVQRL